MSKSPFKFRIESTLFIYDKLKRGKHWENQDIEKCYAHVDALPFPERQYGEYWVRTEKGKVRCFIFLNGEWLEAKHAIQYIMRLEFTPDLVISKEEQEEDRLYQRKEALSWYKTKRRRARESSSESQEVV